MGEMAEANKDLGHARKAHVDQLAEEKRENAKAAARVAAAASALKAAEAAIAGFAKKHHDAASVAAKAKADADAAQALANTKHEVVKMHKEKRDATARKIEQALVQTNEEFGAVKNAMANFASWLKGKDCRMQSSPAHCERKYRLAWGRRLLSAEELNDSDETEAAIQTDSKAKWGGIKKAIKKVIPTKVYYNDCKKKNDCLAANAACKAKLDSLRATVQVLDEEVAKAKKIADAHQATADQKAKYADLKKKDTEAAKAALTEAQSAVSSKAQELADEKKQQANIKSSQASQVKKDYNAMAYAQNEHAKKVEEYKAEKAEMEEANKDLGHARKAHVDQLAEEKRENAKAVARVAAAASALKAAEAAIAGFAKKHHDAASVAAKAKADADAAQALANVKHEVVKLHKEKRDATAKKTEQA